MSKSYLSDSEEMQVLDLYRKHSTISVAEQMGISVGTVSSIVRRHRREVGYFKHRANPVHPEVSVHKVVPFEKIAHRGRASSLPLSPTADATPETHVEQALWDGSHRNQHRMALDTTLALLRHEISECSLKLENFDSELETLTEMWGKVVEASHAVLAKQDALVAASTEVEALIKEAE